MRSHRIPVALLAAICLGCESGHEVLDVEPHNRERVIALPGTIQPIPTSLNDCFATLKRILSSREVAELKGRSETEVARYHHGLGRWIRNYWGLWTGQGPLFGYMRELGLTHPDDMSALILTTFWRHLHGEPLRVQAEVELYQAYWRVHSPPKDPSCPDERSPLTFTVVLDRELPDGAPRAIYLGRCCVDGAIWAWEHDDGFYRPTGSLQVDVQRAFSESWDACENEGELPIILHR